MFFRAKCDEMDVKVTKNRAYSAAYSVVLQNQVLSYCLLLFHFIPFSTL